MNETPRKVIESSEKCYLCSLSCLKNNRVFIFGKSTINICSILSSAIDVDVRKYSESADLSICKNICYKLVLRFNNSLDKCNNIKEEIKEKFQSERQVRTKRLRSREESPKDSSKQSHHAELSKTTKVQRHCVAAKSLQFNDTSTTCTSSENSLPVEQCITVLDSSPFSLQPTSSLFMNQPKSLPDLAIAASSPLFCSTPVLSSKSAGTRDVVKGTVRMTIHHPSKSVTKTLDHTYEAVGKALFYGPPSRVATAVMNCEPIRKEVTKKVLRIVSKEVNSLCSRREPSILRKCEKNDLMNFDMQLLCQEWAQRAPLFHSFLLTCACSKSTANATWLPSIAISGSVLLKQRNPHMNATASVLGILLKSKSIEVSNILKYSTVEYTIFTLDVIFSHFR